MKIKIKDIIDSKPCEEGLDIFKASLKPNQKVTTIKEIIKSNGLSDTLWVIANVLKDRKACVDLAKQFADSVKHLRSANYAARVTPNAAYYARAAAADAAHYADYTANAASAARAAVSAVYAASASAYAAYAADYTTTTAYNKERTKQEQMIINYSK